MAIIVAEGWEVGPCVYTLWNRNEGNIRNIPPAQIESGSAICFACFGCFGSMGYVANPRVGEVFAGVPLQCLVSEPHLVGAYGEGLKLARQPQFAERLAPEIAPRGLFHRHQGFHQLPAGETV